ncbi:polysaccharide deacetylase [Nocardia tenerifensis]|uniref:Polysaccharide deacetylase n=1 Tax=Nocardia tenerifensis TaxID=228006 RepID=A0A318JVJ2_9NOCA|nr:polysaccharide deacetylase family protein [Nocardia tenerifensis]PXX57391.1 polysaccharide deacetylase [Nocardia tenerifensis]
MSEAPIRWPGGKQAAVIITVAVELWSPGHWPVYAPMAAAWPLPGVLDTHSVSWSEYGATTGVWRLLDILRHVPATFGANGLVAERFPQAVKAVHDAGHGIAAHSYAQDVIPALLDVRAERENIRRCTAILGDLTGVRPIGWMSPRASGTTNNPDLLAEAGYLWSGDYNDYELPRVLTTRHGPLVAIMHSALSDIRGAAGPRDYLDSHVDLLNDVLDAPGAGIYNLTVHAHVGARPLLSGMFVRILEHIESVSDKVWLAAHRQVAEHIVSQQNSEGSCADHG